MDRVLEERTAARVRPVGAPRAVPGHDVAGGPVLIVAQHVPHRCAELTRPHEIAQAVDDGMEAGMEADLCDDAGSQHEIAHLSHGREADGERLLTEQRLARRDRGVDEPCDASSWE